MICVAMALCAQGPWTPQEERGRQIYEHGTSSSGAPIMASLGGDTQMSGSIVPCANCHGLDGKGNPESGIYPSNITWDVLTRPYKVTNADGRTRPAYSERLLRRAFTMGIDSGGNLLNDAMPRFQMSQADAADLIAYIRRLGFTPEPGLSLSSIRIGIVLPPAGGDSRVAEMTRQALIDAFKPVNSEGGIFGRRIDLVFMQAPENPAQRAASIRAFLAQQQVFASIVDMTGDEPEIASVFESAKTPAIAMYAPFPAASASQNRYVFYLDGGAREELRALVQFAAHQLHAHSGNSVIVTSSDDLSREAVMRLQTMLLGSSMLPRTVTHIDAKGAPAVIFWLQKADALPDAGAAAHSTVLIPAMFLADSDPLPGSLPAQTYVAIEGESWQGKISGQPRWIWARATTAASLLVEGLRASGRDVTRDDLITAMEDFKDAETALPERVTFGPNRRIGAPEVRVMKLDSSGYKLAALNSGQVLDK